MLCLEHLECSATAGRWFSVLVSLLCKRNVAAGLTFTLLTRAGDLVNTSLCIGGWEFTFILLYSVY
jgi:hypothetical protein